MTTLMPPAADGALTAERGSAAVTAATAFVDPMVQRPMPGGYVPASARKEAPHSAAEPAVDIMALLGRCLGNFELIVRVLARFRKTGGADLEQLGGAVERSDFAAVVEISHRFK